MRKILVENSSPFSHYLPLLQCFHLQKDENTGLLELAQIIPVPEKSSDAGKPRQLVTLILGYDRASVPLQNNPTDSGEKNILHYLDDTKIQRP